MLEGNLEGDAERDSLQSSGSHSNDPHSSNHSNTDVHTSNHSNQSESDSDDSVEIPRLLSRTWDRTLHLEDHGDVEEDCGMWNSKPATQSLAHTGGGGRFRVPYLINLLY